MAGGVRAERPLVFAIVLLGTLVYGAVAWLPMNDLVGLCVADDAFYYLTIARNVARGYGASFDGSTLTNGFHPIYLLVLAFLFKLLGAGSGELVLHLGLSLLAAATLLTGWLIRAIARRTLDAQAGVLALMLWLGNPQVLLASMQGVEAPLATAALALALWLSVRARSAGAPSVRDMAVIGATLGFACLCRTDSVIFGAVLAPALAISIARSTGIRPALVRGAALAGSAAMVIAPWLAWNLVRFGRISQDSARAISGLRHARFAEMNPSGAWPAAIAQRIVRRFADFGGQLGFGAAGGVVMVVLLLAPFALAWHARRTSAGSEATAVTGSRFPAILLALAAALTLTFYGGVFWFAQRWYYVGPLFATTLLATFLVSRLGGLTRRRPVLAIATALALIGFVTTGVTTRSLYPWQQQYLKVATNLRKLPAGARIGSFNSGIYGFVLDRGVVNLDGVVNGRVYEAMRRHQLLAYMTGEARLTYVLDHASTIGSYASFAEPGYGRAFQRLANFATGSTGGDLLLLRLVQTGSDAPTAP